MTHWLERGGRAMRTWRPTGRSSENSKSVGFSDEVVLCCGVLAQVFQELREGVALC